MTAVNKEHTLNLQSILIHVCTIYLSFYLSFSIFLLIIFDLHREHFDPLSEQWAVFSLKA